MMNHVEFIECDPMNGLVLGPVIGKGSFAQVRIGKRIERQNKHIANHMSAIKCIEKEEYFKSCPNSNINMEIEILSRCTQLKYVAQLQFVLTTPSTLFIGLEYCSGGDLFQKLSSETTSEQDHYYIRQIAIALSLLHQNGILYHDLKPENVCFDHNDNVKLIDFGLAMILDDSCYNPATNRMEVVSGGGSLEYAAPEIFLREPHGFEADWWSFGVLAYELLCGDLPFQKEGNMEEKAAYICSSASFKRNDIISENSLEESFISMFLNKSQCDRFGYNNNESVMTILTHPLFL